MKKIFFVLAFILVSSSLSAQYGTINKMLQRLEERKGINQNLSDVDINNKKFVLIKDFDDHTERLFISINGNVATFAEVFDDKKTGESSSNVFTGDMVRTNNNILSFRFDKLENKKIAMPLSKTLLMTKQKKILYLVDINTKERWIDEASFGKQ